MSSDPIKLSLFDIFKAGPGPSSSHTIGPMCAALKFVEFAKELPEERKKTATGVEVRLYGSLSATGKGHGTDKAVAAGLLGMEPASCDVDALASIFDNGAEYSFDIGHRPIKFNRSDIIFDSVQHNFPFSNTMLVKLLSGNSSIFEMEFYSVGGGFIRWKGDLPPNRPDPVYKYSNMNEFKKVLASSGIGFDELMLQNEEAITGDSRKEIERKLDDVIGVMIDSVDRGLATEGLLPGPIGLERRAKGLNDIVLKDIIQNPDNHAIVRSMLRLNAYALAASEENAAGHIVVTAPTSGSAGVIPSIIYFMKQRFGKSSKELRSAMLAAALIAFIAKQNASISGAEVGCQGEIGVASSMAAAMVAHIRGYSIDVMESAAEIALEHRLGMTCDPIKGYVQIPCIERNAVAAVEAYNAYLLASVRGVGKQKISFDQILETMMRTGRDMSSKYKETSEGGLALCDAIC